MTNTHSTFFFSDPHFFHKKLIRGTEGNFGEHARPFDTIEEHNETIVNNWNSVVKNNDVVWVLGDCVFAGKENLVIFERLKGKKRLVLGNHDTGSKDKYMKYFEKVEGAVEYGADIILTHIPVHPQCLVGRWRLNIHGHTHGDIIRDTRYASSNARPDPRYICVSLEQTGYFPLTYNQVMEKVKEKKNAV